MKRKLRGLICLLLTAVMLGSVSADAGVFDLFKIPGKIKAAKEAISAAKLIAANISEIKQQAEAAVNELRKNNTITLHNARIMAVDKSNAILQNTLQITKKTMEKRQALTAIADTREKENTVQYSLLIKIKWPEKHGLPKELELLAKIPQLDSELDILAQQRDYEIRKVVADVDQKYFDVLCYEYVAQDLQNRIAEDTATLERIRLSYAKGESKKSDVELMEKQVAALEKEYNQVVKKYNTAKADLSTLIAKDVKTGCTFEPILSEADFDRNALPDILAYAKANDFELYKATQKRLLAEQETDILLGIYKQAYGSKILDIENYINNHPDIDYEDFLKKYSSALKAIDDPWTGTYNIRIIFFTLRIPKIWFKKKFDGTRYLEDEKFILYTTLVDRDAARKEEAAAIQNLETTINTSYDNLKTMQSAMQDSEENLRISEADYNYQLGQNKKGLVSFDALESTRQAFYSSQQAQFEQLMDYCKSLSAFNEETSGYVDFFLEEGSFSGSSLQSGVSFIEDVTWTVDENLTEYNFTLYVTIPQTYDCNYFQLYYGDTPVGGKTAADTPLVHSALTFDDAKLLSVRLYKNDTLKYTGVFDDGVSSGVIKITQAEGGAPEPEQKLVGSWNLSEADSYRMKLSFTLTENYDYDSYAIVYNGNFVATAQKSQPITALSQYFGNMSLLGIQLLKNNQPVQNLTFSLTGSLGGDLLAAD